MKSRILFVDDDLSLGETVRHMLEQMGYEARSESDPRKVFAAFATNSPKFDGVILDQLMPQVSGLEFARWLSYTRPHVPVILVSSYPDIVRSMEEEPANILAVLTKPFSRTDLSRALDLALSASVGLNGTEDRVALSPGGSL